MLHTVGFHDKKTDGLLIQNSFETMAVGTLGKPHALRAKSENTLKIIEPVGDLGCNGFGL